MSCADYFDIYGQAGKYSFYKVLRMMYGLHTNLISFCLRERLGILSL